MLRVSRIGSWRVFCVGMLLCIAPLCVALPASAGRLAVFGLHCWPVTGYHTTAALYGTVTFAKSPPVVFTATCSDGPTASGFPEITDAMGKVVGIDVEVIATLEAFGPKGQSIGPGVFATCTFGTSNSFLQGRCLANDTLQFGDVDMLVNVQNDGFYTGTTLMRR